jgi:hypothetical protein
MKCPYLEEDEECTCVKKKWPVRYSIWNLTPGQISEIESIRPKRRLYPRKTKNVHAWYAGKRSGQPGTAYGTLQVQHMEPRAWTNIRD